MARAPLQHSANDDGDEQGNCTTLVKQRTLRDARSKRVQTKRKSAVSMAPCSAAVAASARSSLPVACRHSVSGRVRCCGRTDAHRAADDVARKGDVSRLDAHAVDRFAAATTRALSDATHRSTAYVSSPLGRSPRSPTMKPAATPGREAADRQSERSRNEVEERAEAPSAMQASRCEGLCAERRG